MIEKRESVTAKLCAFARAWHSNKGRNKIFDDYLAYDMMGKDEYDGVYDLIKHGFGHISNQLSHDDSEEIIKEYIAPIPLARIHFTENRLEKFAEKYGKIQYVICGAGSDTFSFRNANKNIEIFEVDHPDTQRYKLGKVRELEWNIPENVHFVAMDFEKDKLTQRLSEAGFNPNIKTFFSILGVSYYLTLPTFTKTLSQISELSAMGSVLAFDYPIKGSNYPRRIYRLEEITGSLGEYMQGGFEYGEISRALYALGFQIDTCFSPEKVQSEYFDKRTDGLRAFENVSLISAEYTGGFDYE